MSLSEPLSRNDLARLLTRHFNASELNQLCFSLNVDYENLSGETTSRLAYALIDYLRRRNRLPELLESVSLLRPGLDLSAYSRAEGAYTGPARSATFDTTTVPDPRPLPSGSRMPIAAGQNFIGRGDDLLHLAQLLNEGDVVIMGTPGSGKTQLAVEYAHRFGYSYYGGVFWLMFAQPASIAAEVAACGQAISLLGLPDDFDLLPLNEQVQLVQNAWQEPTPRLLIFDDCDDPALYHRWRPPGSLCRVLVTSRYDTWTGVQQLSLSTLSASESVALLRRYYPTLNTDDALALADALDYLPMALRLAGYLLRSGLDDPTITVRELLNQLLAEPDFAKRKQRGTLMETLAVSYSRLNLDQPVDARAALLLTRAAYLVPGESIPRQLLLKLARAPDTQPVRE